MKFELEVNVFAEADTYPTIAEVRFNKKFLERVLKMRDAVVNCGATAMTVYDDKHVKWFSGPEVGMTPEEREAEGCYEVEPEDVLLWVKPDYFFWAGYMTEGFNEDDPAPVETDTIKFEDLE